jgi:hypothetical protein
MAYDSFYIPAMRYSLAISSINQTDLETIQRNATTPLLAALGYNRHMPREVVFCQRKYQGLGLKHLYDLQGKDSVRLLLQELNSDNTTNTMLKLWIESIQMEAGIQKPILEDTQPLLYIEWGWIPGIRDFLHHIDAKITNLTTGLQTYRENDQLIMDSTILPTMTMKEQILINRCRLHLQVECLSDIADTTGQHIQAQWENNSPVKPSRSSKKWPLQGDPGREAWLIWKKFLSRAFLMTSGKSRVKLGKWTHRNPTREYNTYWSTSLSTLLLTNDCNSWNHHRMIQTGRRQNYFEKTTNRSSSLPDDAVPAEITADTNQYYITGTLAEWHKKTPSRTTTFLEKIVHQQNDTLFSTIEVLVEESDFGSLFDKQALIDTATDGGHDPNTGILTYGWVISVNETIIAKGRGPAEAHPSMAESFRAEAYGLASATAFLKLLIQHFQISTQEHRWFFFHMDSKTLIQRMESYITEAITPKWSHKPDVDITNTVHMNLIGINAHFRHVKGHQEKSKSNKQKSFHSTLNIMADELATRQRQNMTSPKTEVTTLHHHIKIGDMFITRDSQRWILEMASRIPIQQYYRDKYGWTKQTFQEIDWELQHRVLSSYDINDQRRILKFVQGWLPMNYRLHREKQSPTQRCPLCHYLEEHELHLFQCLHPIQQEKKTEMLRQLTEIKGVHPGALRLVIKSLHGSLNDNTWQSTDVPLHLRQASNSQTKIGWQHLVYGRMAKALTQQLAEDPNKTTTPTCGRQLVRHIWDTFLILWKQRNNLVHNEATTTKAERQKIALTSRVQKCFDKQDQLNHDDRQKIFRKQQDELMEEDPRTIKTWVKLAERIIRTSKKEQRRQTGQREMMEQYFKWHPPEKGRHRKHSKQRHKQDLKPD